MHATIQQQAQPRSGSEMEPLIWVMLGNKLGDNSQVMALVDELGLPFERRDLVMREQFEVGKPTFEPTLNHLDFHQSDKLEPPWPDLILTSGRRPSMAALWIKQQSGGKSKIAIVGRPKRWIDRFDLIIVPPQFRVADRANVLHIQLPLMRLDPEKVRIAALTWHDRLAAMPKPLTAVMVGGATKPFRFDRTIAQRLMDDIDSSLGRDGGSVFIATSRRTGAEVASFIESRLPKGSKIFRWDRDGANDNPYHALMALADRCVVTSDSVSMQVEAIKLGRPLAVFELPIGKSLKLWWHHKIHRWLASEGRLGLLGDFLTDRGLRGSSRDLPGFQDQLYRSGLAVRLGQPFPNTKTTLVDDLDMSVRRVKALISK